MDAEAAQGADGLGRQAEVADGRDTGADDAADLVGLLEAAFELDGFAAGFGHEHKAAGVADGGLDGGLVGFVGHIANQEGGRGAAASALELALSKFSGTSTTSMTA